MILFHYRRDTCFDAHLFSTPFLLVTLGYRCLRTQQINITNAKGLFVELEYMFSICICLGPQLGFDIIGRYIDISENKVLSENMRLHTISNLTDVK